MRSSSLKTEKLLPRKRIGDDPPGSGYSRLDGTARYPLALIGFLVTLVILFGAWGITMSTLFAGRVEPRCTTMCGDMLIYCDEFCVTDIIVGGGNTGLSVANRLSQNTTRNVLVLEAGGDYVNDLYANDMGDGLRWESVYLTDPYRYYFSESTELQLNSFQMNTVRGRELGGSSSVNDAELIRGTIGFWDNLDTLMGGTGKFAGDNVYEVYKQIEYLNPSPVYTPDVTTNGLTENAWKVAVYPTVLNPSDDTHVIANLFSGAFGIPNEGTLMRGVNDPLVTIGAIPSGDWLYDFNATKDPIIRWSSRKAFLNASVMDQTLYYGPRIRVLLESTVQKILFHPTDPTKAVGVEYLDANRVTHRAFATQNVVLSAWINDVGILQRSGIGPAATLSSAGITPRIINENVGRHWKTHLFIPTAFLFPNMTGIANPEDVPQISGLAGHFVEDTVLCAPGERGYQLISISYPFVLAFFNAQLKSRSEGTIDIYTDDPQQWPLYNPNIYGNTDDILSWRTHLRTIIPAMEAYDPNIISLSIDNVTLYDDVLLDQWIIDNTLSTSSITHNFGTCRLGTSAATGVVDANFKVYGAKNLRVCDVSVFPDQTDGNPSYPGAAIGQICALSIMDLPTPTPPAKKRTSSSSKKSFSVPLKGASGKRAASPPLTDRQKYDAIVNYFNQVKATRPGEADQIIASVQKNEPWKSLAAQFGPYVYTPPVNKKKKLLQK